MGYYAFVSDDLNSLLEPPELQQPREVTAASA
jgi:hypothetical protein